MSHDLVAFVSKVARIIDGGLLADEFNPSDRRALVRLFLIVFLASKRGKPLAKKYAGRESGWEDGRTTGKYIALAIDHGYVSVTKNQDDMRQHLLIPTKKLEDFIQRSYDL